MAVITGIGILKNLDNLNIEDEISRLENRIVQVKLFNNIEKLAVLSAAKALNDASIDFPVGNDSLCIFAGIDEGIDGIKFRYYNSVLKEGPIGASPALFPFTSPNAVSAQISIAFDTRGECITLPAGTLSSARALGYASECIQLKKTDAAIAGGATIAADELKKAAGFFVLESKKHAKIRNAKIYGEIVGYFEMFNNTEYKKNIIDDVLSVCHKELGIQKDSIGIIYLMTQSEDALYPNLRLNIVKPYALSASYAIMIADYLKDKSFQGKALFIAEDSFGNISVMLISKCTQ